MSQFPDQFPNQSSASCFSEASYKDRNERGLDQFRAQKDRWIRRKYAYDSVFNSAAIQPIKPMRPPIGT